jgi:hypothetical protein
MVQREHDAVRIEVDDGVGTGIAKPLGRSGRLSRPSFGYREKKLHVFVAVPHGDDDRLQEG